MAFLNIGSNIVGRSTPKERMSNKKATIRNTSVVATKTGKRRKNPYVEINVDNGRRTSYVEWCCRIIITHSKLLRFVWSFRCEKCMQLWCSNLHSKSQIRKKVRYWRCTRPTNDCCFWVFNKLILLRFITFGHWWITINTTNGMSVYDQLLMVSPRNWNCNPFRFPSIATALKSV